MVMMRESEIENYLVKQVAKVGGLCWKWAGKAGVPDRIVVMEAGVVVFVEVKAAKGRLAPMQQRVHHQLTELGSRVEVVWSREDVDVLMADLSNEINVEC
jgi:G:T-mismatch repair DNA endonuclease (very short patch repair protein)